MHTILFAVLLSTLGAFVGAHSHRHQPAKVVHAPGLLAAGSLNKRVIANGEIEYTQGKLEYPAKRIYHDHKNVISPPSDMRKVIGYAGAKRVHYVKLRAIQSNNNGDAVVTSGGIGLTSIEILVTAKDTNQFLYDFEMYSNDI